MKSALIRIFSHPYLLILLAVIIKVPLFFTRHIQEDSFITWRVARNLLDFGVIGFNGEERISASTTHLYVLVSAFFQFIFGGNFIYPLLIFSGILFAVGTFWLAKIFFENDDLKRGFFVLFLNATPPALTASFLGMEYGLLFFLYCGLIYLGLQKGKKWAYFLFPVLMLWTRIDSVVFLGIIFLADIVLRKRLNTSFIFGGLVGLASVILFNYFYFGEFVNHTITAKKLAYRNLLQNSSPEFYLFQWAYYGGLIKKYSVFTFILWLAFLGFLGWIIFKVVRDKNTASTRAKIILISVVVFALAKISVFAFLKAYFDWYYWLPRTFLFVAVLFYLLDYVRLRLRILLLLMIIGSLGLYASQLLQSYAIGYMEHGQRMQVAKDILAVSGGKGGSVLLEPAGIIPFYTRLYTYDEVGLVNKKITAEMLADENYWWSNSVRKFQPTYILTVGAQAGNPDTFYRMQRNDEQNFLKDYKLLRKYRISKIYEEAPEMLRWIYKIRPIGKDYYLYVRQQKNKVQ
ncbi:hypothetical protein [Kaistella palustris]|uniref:hypothetical protein n=1 Tax=Kaistella palustris TaxID=493376 RepID=UPI000421416C|nr:hypothetical protein [Kaistella palustris]